MKKIITVLLLIMTFSSVNAAENKDVLYVDADGNGGNGKSWEGAYTSLQDALTAAEEGTQIWVSEGTYTPTEGGDRSVSFELVKGVDVYGGFSGIESSLEERDWINHKTILSGNIGDTETSEDNSFHVVVGADDAVLDGFMVTEGRSDNLMPPPRENRNEGKMKRTHTTPDAVMASVEPVVGAGMVNFQAAPVVRNCTFSNNRALKGGGMYNMVATRAVAHTGSADSYPIIINCTFENNYAVVRGGGVANDLTTSPIIIDCRFVNNVCDDKGAGMYNDFTCSPLIVNCLFTGNSAVYAGGMGNDGSSKPKILNTTIAYNSASDFGAGLYQGSGPRNMPVVKNSVIWGNDTETGEDSIYDWHECETTVTDSVVEGGYPGTNVIDRDPCFTDPENGDYSLKEISPVHGMGYGYDAELAGDSGQDRYEELISEGIEYIGSIEVEQVYDSIPGESVSMGDAVLTDDVVYVRSGEKDVEDGNSWKTAFSSLQSALDRAAVADAAVWIVEGVYYPEETNGRSSTFQLRENVKVYGGFSGNETSLDQRDPEKHRTVLSGDIGTCGDRSDNSYHVLIGAEGAYLDGLTVTAGNADGLSYNGKGGGLLNYYPGLNMTMDAVSGYNTAFHNCLFLKNYANEGGAVYTYHAVSPLFDNCRFIGNKAKNGAATMERVGPTAQYTNCVFKDNAALFKGGVSCIDYGGRPSYENCTFEGNSVGYSGGCFYFLSRGSQLDNTMGTVSACMFLDNTAETGGVAYVNDKSYVTFESCDFRGNRSVNEGAVLYTGFDSTSSVIDCTFSSNRSENGYNDTDNHATGTTVTE